MAKYLGNVYNGSSSLASCGADGCPLAGCPANACVAAGCYIAACIPANACFACFVDILPNSESGVR